MATQPAYIWNLNDGGTINVIAGFHYSEYKESF